MLINSKQIMEKEEVIIKMKRLLVLLTLVVGLLGFSAGAFAQVGIPICNSCDKSPIGTLDCPTGAQDSACLDYPFNYQTRQGYGTTTDGPGIYDLTNTPYRAIFNICNCETAATSFVEGNRIGIRLTMLVNGVSGDNLGAYWADTAAATNIEFGSYAESSETCTDTAYLSLGTGGLTDRHFGPGKYYLADGVTEVAATYLGTACVVPAANRAVVVNTNVDSGYMITSDDVLNKLSRWWIILPEMRVDVNVVKPNDVISVRIETLDQASGGICATCRATCVCVIDVAIMCPTAPTSSGCIFPYFTSTTAGGDYWNGIAIVNTGSTAGNATLTVYQQDGATGTFTTPSIAGHGMYVAALENIGFTGTGLGAMPIYISVSSTFSSLDGFAMIANSSTGESMGYLCRQQ